VKKNDFKKKLHYKMAIQYLLKSNSQNIDLVDYYVDNLSQLNYSQEAPQKKLQLSVTNGNETIKGFFIRDGVTLCKEETKNYSSALISDATFINNLQYFINMYGVNLEHPVQVFLNEQELTVSRYIYMAAQRFYILE
jgi:hypothetical protein